MQRLSFKSPSAVDRSLMLSSGSTQRVVSISEIWISHCEVDFKKRSREGGEFRGGAWWSGLGKVVEAQDHKQN